MDPESNTDTGSSPLSRGIPKGDYENAIADRIIPALAGNTEFLLPASGTNSDHPRSRGEYVAWRLCITFRRGSSPLSRGIRMTGACGWIWLRIIPALAGNTYNAKVEEFSKRDHPRSRGEYDVWQTWGYGVRGSSPLSRGIPPVTVTPHPLAGIIPALAGNTVPLVPSHQRCQDHPRSRGEYGILSRIALVPQGSSPLSRGILTRINQMSLKHGIIPALAGNTSQ